MLVGDPSYYDRFGFSAEKTGALWVCWAPYERERLLARPQLEFPARFLDGARGPIGATGEARKALVPAGPRDPHCGTFRADADARVRHLIKVRQEL